MSHMFSLMVNTIRNELNKNKKLVTEISTQSKTIMFNSEKSSYSVIYLPLILIHVYFLYYYGSIKVCS